MNKPKFSRKAVVGNKGDVDPSIKKEDKPFVRDNSDNKTFKNIQVKDISGIITEDFNVAYDADTLIYQACDNVQTKFIRVTHVDKSFSEDMKGIAVFKGQGNGIKTGSWLWTKNLEREVSGLPLYTPEDFTVEHMQKLNYDSPEKAIEAAKIGVFKKMKEVRLQFNVPRVTLVIGEGDNFRHKLPLVRKYKGNRKKADRPIILDEIRAWAVKELSAIESGKRYDGEGTEADDVCEFYGAIGYKHYLETGKFNWAVCASDKDARNNPKLLLSPDKHVGKDNPLRGKFKLPQAMLIENSIRDCGGLEATMTSKVEYKFYGFFGILWQSFLGGDQADNYNCLSHLVDYKLSFGDESAYKLLKPCKTAKEGLQTTIDKFAELLPYGVQYTDCHGVEQDVDTITYMDTYFKVAYMMKSYEDKLDFYKLCKAFKVDTSKIVGNNNYTAPIKTYVGCEDNVNEIEDLIQSILKEDMKGLKSMKKANQAIVIDRIKEKLESISFESHYEMKQTLKEGFTE